MSNKKHLTQIFAKESPIIRLAILEHSIGELNRKIQMAQGVQKEWLMREISYKNAIAKKYEYHKILIEEIKNSSKQKEHIDPLDDENSYLSKIGREIADMTDEDFEANCKRFEKLIKK